MHADIQQLLSLRDGEPVDADVMRHVENCTVCGGELARLVRMQSRLQALPPIDPPAMAWERIDIRVREASSPQPRRVPWAIAAAVAVTVVSGLLVREVDTVSETAPVAIVSTQEQSPPVATAIPLEALVAQSQELDELLLYLPQRPAVERVSMAATIDTIEQRVQWLDQQLSYASDTGLNEEQAYQLWRERVDLMDSLVKVRYAEGRSLSF
ncbi:hypothetical protein HNQ60_005486 [Povalibacter uvarum]|uniref:Zinc-finger domain-containing protein n=1 Tax=Povalibacter uvarum TaxID=732238 RepID=A0A841HV82_9GAMM|nr:hypothetical protein [Povalibacter uvarum]MBB6096564.1 hypothetical protein [Povalibacter uvarum]